MTTSTTKRNPGTISFNKPKQQLKNDPVSIMLKDCRDRKDTSTQTAIFVCNKVRDYSNMKLLCKTEVPAVSVYVEDFSLELECKNKVHHVECIKIVEKKKISDEIKEEFPGKLSTIIDNLPSVTGQLKKCEVEEKKSNIKLIRILLLPLLQRKNKKNR